MKARSPRKIDVKIESTETIEDGMGESEHNFDAKLVKDQAKDSFREFLKTRRNLTNWLIFVYLFCAASFNYYLLNFYLKYMPGDLYTNSIVSSLSEAVAHILAGWIVTKVGPVNGLSFALFLATLSAFSLWVCTAKDWLEPVPFTVLAAKFGTGGAFAMLYMSTLQFFPPRFLGRVFGTCNVTARFVTIMAPMIAEAPDPLPELIMIISCLIGAILARFLHKPSSTDMPDVARAEKAIELASQKF